MNISLFCIITYAGYLETAKKSDGETIPVNRNNIYNEKYGEENCAGWSFDSAKNEIVNCTIPCRSAKGQKGCSKWHPRVSYRNERMAHHGVNSIWRMQQGFRWTISSTESIDVSYIDEFVCFTRIKQVHLTPVNVEDLQ